MFIVKISVPKGSPCFHIESSTWMEEKMISNMQGLNQSGNCKCVKCLTNGNAGAVTEEKGDRQTAHEERRAVADDEPSRKWAEEEEDYVPDASHF